MHFDSLRWKARGTVGTQFWLGGAAVKVLEKLFANPKPDSSVARAAAR